MDIHNLKVRYERVLARFKELPISEQNKETILKFHNFLLSEGIGYSKIERYFYDLMKLDRLLKKEFREANEEDIRRVVSEINQQDLSEHTKRGFKLIVRRFYRFIRGCSKDDPHPPEVKWISLKMGHKHSKLPEELLTEEEFVSIIKHCETIRDKALISIIAESGARVGEIGTMQIKHISFEKYGARLTVNGKTGMRKILVVSSAPLLQRWLNDHPKNDDPNACLWYNTTGRGELLCYKRIDTILKMAAKRAGIKKRMHLHLLRHSRATQLASIMSEASMKQYLGWVQGSSMAAVYVHMSGKDTDKAVLQANGIQIENETKSQSFAPIHCIRCETTNPPINKFCKQCGLVLKKEEANEILKQEIKNEEMNTLMTRILKDPEVWKLVNSKMSNFV